MRGDWTCGRQELERAYARWGEAPAFRRQKTAGSWTWEESARCRYAGTGSEGVQHSQKDDEDNLVGVVVVNVLG